jgi:hypothetical protein
VDEAAKSMNLNGSGDAEIGATVRLQRVQLPPGNWFAPPGNNRSDGGGIDPNLLSAAGNLITNRVERGELEKAYQQARVLVRKRPQSAQVHFTLGYVLRYAGMLQEAAQECGRVLLSYPLIRQYHCFIGKCLPNGCQLE